MSCSLCNKEFKIHKPTYHKISLPAAGQNGLWKKGVRGAIAQNEFDVCGDCLRVLIDAQLDCSLRSEPDMSIKTKEPVIEKKVSTDTRVGTMSTSSGVTLKN